MPWYYLFQCTLKVDVQRTPSTFCSRSAQNYSNQTQCHSGCLTSKIAIFRPGQTKTPRITSGWCKSSRIMFCGFVHSWSVTPSSLCDCCQLISQFQWLVLLQWTANCSCTNCCSRRSCYGCSLSFANVPPHSPSTDIAFCAVQSHCWQNRMRISRFPYVNWLHRWKGQIPFCHAMWRYLEPSFLFSAKNLLQRFQQWDACTRW